MENRVVQDGLRRAVLTVLLIIGVALTLNSALAAQSVTLEWNPSTDPSVTGYNIYYGAASRTYTNKIDVGNSTNVTINGLVEGVTYYFAATAYNVLGAESDYSAEVSYTVPLPAGNAPPTLTAITNLTINEDAAMQTVNLAGISAGPGESQPLTVTASSSNTGLIPNPTVNYTSPNATGSLNFTPVANAFGSAIITVTVNDNQGSNNLFSRTFTVTVNPVNDPPTLDPINNFSINEDGGLQTVNLTGITAGPNESQTLTVTASSSNTGLIPNPTVTYASPNSAGSLSFTPVTNASGTTTITVTVNDGQAANNLTTRTFTVTVAAVNDPPTLNPINDVTVNENAAAQTVSLTGITAGAGESQTLTVTASSSNTGLIPNPTVSYTSPSGNGSLSFTPGGNTTGSAVITVTVNDNQGSNNLFSRTFTVTVSPVNQPPTLDPINNFSINEDSGLQTVNLTGITAGANESQTLTVTASSSNTGLIPNPTVNYTSPSLTGSLSFTPATNATGSATITVTINDGQTTNNILTRTFTVTVAPVNDPPTLNPINDVTINENAAAQTVSLSGITAGPGESQTLTVTASSSNTGLIPNPTVSYTSPSANGTLSFTPVGSATGSAIITVTVNDNQGSNNLFSRTFTVTVNPVNDPPTLSPISNITINEDSGLQTANLSGITAGTNETQTLTITASSSNTGLIPNPTANYTSPNSTGSLSFTPATNATGTATITVTVNDGQPSNNTVTRTFTVTVAPVNDPPTLNPINDITINQGPGTQVLNLSGISAGPNESQTLTITASSSNTGLVPNPTVSYTSPNAIGSLTLSPSPSGSGTAVITVTVNDGQASNNITTRTFTVTVNSRPMITPISNQTISTNSSTGPIGFVIGDRETPAANLTLFAASSVPSLIPTNNIVFGGSDSNRTVTLTPVLTQSGVANITLTVSDGVAVSNITFQLTVLGPPPPPTGLQIIGNGTVSGTTGPQALTVGQTYTLTAVPAPGQVFAGWSGSYTSSSPKLTFTYQTNTSIQARFIDSPYIPVAGRYNGLFYEDAQINLPTSGYFSIVVTPAGTYSGSLQVGTKKIPFTGKLNLQALGTNRLVFPNSIPAIMDFYPQNGKLTGHITSGLWVSTLHGDLSNFSSTNQAPYRGKYTMVIPGTPGNDLLPAGHSYGTPNVSSNGMVAFSGVLADGTKFTSAAYLSANGDWPLYIPLYKGKGSVLSWMAFADRPNDDINGAVSWIKQPNASPKFYRSGFLYECEAIGSAFTAPPIGANILSLTTGQMTFNGGNLGDGFVNSVAFSTNSHLINLSSNSLVATFSTLKGSYLGKVGKPGNGPKATTTAFNGVVLQKANAAYGFLLGTNQCSQVLLTP